MLQFAGALALPLGAGPVRADPAPYPSRPIRAVPFGTGGGPIDGITRIYGDKLQQRWGQPVIVDPRPGASGVLAANAVAKAPADGYTLLFTLPLTHINEAILRPNLPYDPLRDFTPLSQLATGGPMLIARSGSPFGDLREFVAHAKTHGPVSYGTWGIGSNAHLFGELLKRQTGIELIHVPYKSESAAHADLIGGTLGVSFANPASARSLSGSGKVEVLGVTGSRRVSAMPEIRTFTEQGFAGFDLDSWIGVYAPANTPGAIVETIAAALRDVTHLSDVRAHLVAYGFEPLGNTPSEFIANYKADYPRVAQLIKAAGVTAE
jgi:tripartite-type tricarboxylate transporter receptor subunit TctC